jgi:hypothetical protein
MEKFYYIKTRQLITPMSKLQPKKFYNVGNSRAKPFGRRHLAHAAGSVSTCGARVHLKWPVFNEAVQTENDTKAKDGAMALSRTTLSITPCSVSHFFSFTLSVAI